MGRKFKDYGLNKYKNILSAPECECGCGSKGQLIVENRDALFEFVWDIIADEDKPVAVFMDSKHGKYIAVRNLEDNENIWEDGGLYGGAGQEVDFYNVEGSTFTNLNGKVVSTNEFFSMFDAELCFSGYGLLVEVEPNVYEVVEE